MHRLSLVAAALATIAAAFFSVKVRERDRVLDSFIAETLAGIDRADTNAVVLALARGVFARTNAGKRASELSLYDRLESISPFNVSTAVAVREGIFGVIGHEPYGPCGAMTRVMLNACWRVGIPARKLHLFPGPGARAGVHTVMEWKSGGRWLVISPSDTFVWHARDGRIATVEDIRGDSAVFGQIFASNPAFAIRFDHPRHVRWEKLPPPVRSVTRALLGEARYRNAETPRLYDQPRWLLLLLSLATAATSALLAVLSRPRRAAGRA